MNVTRDFGPALGGGTEYRWSAEVEGKLYSYTSIVSEGRPDLPIEYLERRAQQEIARGIQKVLFGGRYL